MIITHDTTIQEYEAWLATNPPLSQVRRAVNSAFKMVYSAFRSIKNLIKKIDKKHRSCISVAYTIYPLAYDRNGILMADRYNNWQESVAIELSKTRAHIERLNMFDFLEGKAWAAGIFSQKQQRIARIEDELVMEGLFKSAIEILIKK